MFPNLKQEDSKFYEMLEGGHDRDPFYNTPTSGPIQSFETG